MSETTDSPKWFPKIGETVMLISLKRTGQVIKFKTSSIRDGSEALVDMAGIKVWVKVSDLSQPKLPKSKASESSYSHTKTGKLSSPPKGTMTIDLHGHTVRQAEEALAIALDKAILENYSQLEIIHGIGTGVLESFVEKWCGQQPVKLKLQKKPANPGASIVYL